MKGVTIDHATLQRWVIKFMPILEGKFIKKRTRPMLGFKSFRSATKTIAGIELLHMIKKGQLANNDNYNSDFDKFLSLAA